MPGSTINTSCALKCTTEPSGPSEWDGAGGAICFVKGQWIFWEGEKLGQKGYQ